MPQFPKASFEKTLGTHVLPSLCIGCATCVVACPFDCLEYLDEKPSLVKECRICGICAQVCPKYNLSIPELERLVFGRERRSDEEFGIYHRMVIAQVMDPKIREVCQDGGVVTALLVHALNEGLIDGAVLSGVSEAKPLKAVPKLATTINEIIGCAGTRYTYSPSMLALREGVKQKKRSLAFVGTPDQIQAFRRVQALPLKKYSEAVAFTVGVFCSECFTYEGLVDKLIRKELRIEQAEVAKLNIKGKLLVTTKTGRVEEVRMKEAKQQARDCNKKCSDFSAELADVSVGGLGLEGWTFTILRTEKCLNLFKEAEAKGLIRTRKAEEEPQVLDLLAKLSKRKRETATNVGP